MNQIQPPTSTKMNASMLPVLRRRRRKPPGSKNGLMRQILDCDVIVNHISKFLCVGDFHRLHCSGTDQFDRLIDVKLPPPPPHSSSLGRLGFLFSKHERCMLCIKKGPIVQRFGLFVHQACFLAMQENAPRGSHGVYHPAALRGFRSSHSLQGQAFEETVEAITKLGEHEVI
jgi:hypothetical protein